MPKQLDIWTKLGNQSPFRQLKSTMNGIVHLTPNDENRNNTAPFSAAVTSWLSSRRWQIAIAAVAILLTLNLTPPVHSQTESSESVTETAEPLLKSIAISGKCMGPIKYEVTVVDPPSDLAEATLKQTVQQTLDRINQRMSTYIEDSYVSQFNASKSTDFIDCDAETAQVVQRAIEISKLTEGAFDITVGPAVELWSFGRSDWRPGDSFDPPSEDDIKETLKAVGYAKLTVQLNPPRIKKSHPSVQINLSAIAKGYAVDQVWQKLTTMGCKSILVMVGGEVRASGHRSDRTSWRIGLKRPDSFQDDYDAVALISDGAVATSGDYENFRRVGKKRYSHTIDPVTGRPVEHSMASACVLAGDCMTADALATAAIVMGRQRAIELFDGQGNEYYLVDRTGDFSGEYKRYGSAAFPFADEAHRKQLESNSNKQTGEADSIWPVFIASLCVFGLMIFGMAVGAIFNNKPVKGSCGGLANVTNEDGESSCGICSKPVTDCVEFAGAAKPKLHEKRDYPLGAVVSVIFDGSRFLTIKRSQKVKAPGAIGFAGGGVEPSESQEDAIVREMREELGVDVTPIKRVWTCHSPRGVELNFWQVRFAGEQKIKLDPDEVEFYAWHTPGSLREQFNLISSAVPFLDAWNAGEIVLADDPI